MEDDGRRARAESRRGKIVLRKTSLSDDVDQEPVRGEEALSLVTRLTRESWSLAGLEEPAYSRRQIPCRTVPGRIT